MKPNATFGEGRRCEVCNAVLSQYNSGRICRSHDLPADWRVEEIKTKLKGSVCTSPVNVGRALAFKREYGVWDPE